jgi:pimeloyl-ACP methyl ester carboxylesterase
MRVLAAVFAATMLLAACGSGDSSDPQAADESAPAAGPTGDGPAITAGGIESGTVTIDGTEVDYVTVTPDGFEIGDTAPVLLALPPGGQDRSITRSLVEGTYAPQARRRGWVVISPAAPGGQKFFEGSEALVPGLLDWIDTWVSPESGKPHLAGVSNGGLSSFRIVGQNPDRFRSVLVFPGFPRTEEDQAALSGLVDVPVRMFAGENDTGWVGPMQEALTTLTDLGADVTLEIFPGEGHIIGALSDGVQIFDELDALR